MTRQKTLLTADDFLWQYGHLDQHYALAKGAVVEEGMCGALHGYVTSNVLFAIGIFVRQHNLGWVLPSVGFILETGPDTVRGPDVSFTSRERLPEDRDKSGYIPGPPDLAVEVVNFNEIASETEAKLRDYLRTGAKRVWVVYLISRHVMVHHPGGGAVTYDGDDVITDEELLPGFSLPLADIFE